MLTLEWLPPHPLLELAWLDQTMQVVLPPDTPALPLPAAIVGPTGAAGGGTITRVAAEAIGGHRGVAIDADGSARLATPLTGFPLAGLTTGAVAVGGTATIAIGGPVTEPGWSWTPGPVWLGDGGVPTQAVPTSGTLWRLGEAIGPNTLLIRPALVAQL